MKEQESSVDKNKIAAAAMGEIATEVEAGIITSTERVNHTSNGSRSQLLAAVAGDGTMTTTNGTVQQRVNKQCLWFEEELEPDLRWVFGVSKPVDNNKSGGGRGGRGGTWRIFSLRELHAATNSFNYDNKIGEGGFGSVYWGQLPNGDQIAVKRLKVWSTKAEMEFAVEVEILGRVQHKNLLSLRGYCAEGQERLIVYDYMPKLSLLSHLHGQFSSESALNWQRRMKIATGSAEGLAYLHHYAKPHIIHRDIKASNVLLDENFEAQLADFGFAKLIPEGTTHVTTRVKGTLGYLAPEYAMWGKVSEMCDVYSFGILLLELISGRKPIERIGATKRTIVEWAGPLVLQGNFHDLADPKLCGKFHEYELTRVVQAATMCAQNSPANRPTMQQVVEMLKDLNQESTELQDNGSKDWSH